MGRATVPKRSPGKRYEVLIGLNYPTDPAIIKRLLAGENIPQDERGEVRREPGDIVDDIPVASVARLLERGVIREADE